MDGKKVVTRLTQNKVQDKYTVTKQGVRETRRATSSLSLLKQGVQSLAKSREEHSFCAHWPARSCD